MWEQFVIAIIGVILSVVLRPGAAKATDAKPATIDEFDVPTADEGKPIPVIFGRVLVKSPNVVWYGDLSAVPIYSTTSSSK